MKQIQLTPKTDLRIGFHDCDAFGHLNNARYISHFIEARTNHLRDFYDYDVYEDAKTTEKNWVVQNTQIRYFYPARLNDVVEIETRLVRFDKHRLYPEGIMRDKATGKINALVWFELSYVDLKSGRPARHGPELMEFVEKIADADPDLERLDFAKRVDQILSAHGKRDTKVESRVA